MFENQKKFNDLKDKSYLKYDFYLPEKNTLIEFNGKQHYKEIAFFGGRKKFLKQKHHDWLKRKYAIKNNIIESIPLKKATILIMKFFQRMK